MKQKLPKFKMGEISQENRRKMAEDYVDEVNEATPDDTILFIEAEQMAKR